MSSLTHYIELKLIPQAELIQSQVMSFVMQGIHYVLPSYEGRVGIGFPNYSQSSTLGGLVRLFGSEADCHRLLQDLQRGELQNYVLISSIEKIPENINQYACFNREQTKGESSIRRSKKRLEQQGKWSDEVEGKMRLKWIENLSLPHVHLNSASTKQRFILFIKQKKTIKLKEGNFNAYGLSAEATVPIF